MIASLLAKFGAEPHDGAIDAAQDIMYDAWDASDRKRQIALAKKALGKAAFREDVGNFWGLLETRPYMRARYGLAHTLWDKGLRDEAVMHYKDMLRLNPNDNQGIRCLLIDCLLILGRDDEAATLFNRYRDDGSAAWGWSHALLAFRRSGDCPESRSTLSQAIGDNTHVAALLLGNKKMPRQLAAYIGMGDKNEAVAYVHGAAEAWSATRNALVWVRACQP